MSMKKAFQSYWKCISLKDRLQSVLHPNKPFKCIVCYLLNHQNVCFMCQVSSKQIISEKGRPVSQDDILVVRDLIMVRGRWI